MNQIGQRDARRRAARSKQWETPSTQGNRAQRRHPVRENTRKVIFQGSTQSANAPARHGTVAKGGGKAS